MIVGVPFLDVLTRGVLAVGGAGLLFEIGIQWFRAAVRQASDDDRPFS